MSSDTGLSGLLSRFWKKIVDHFEDYEIKRETILNRISMILILFVGVIIRLFGLFQGFDPLIKAFDPHVQLVSAEFINTEGFVQFIHWFKADSWYPYGFQTGIELYWGVPLSAVIIYGLVSIFSISITITQAAFFSPVVYGFLTIIASYYLGKEAVSSRTGIFTAFFMSIAPAFVSRSTAGFYDNESIGILFTVLTLYFFIRAFKRGGTVAPFLAGISLGILIGSWGAYRYILDLLPLAVLFLVLARKLTWKLIKAYSITIVTALSIGFLVPRVLRNKFFNIEVMIPVLMIGFLVIVGIIQNLSHNLNEKTFRQMLIVGAVTALVLLVILVTVFLSLGVFSNIADKFWAVIFPGGRDSIPIIASVSEHQPMTWAELFSNIHIMTFLIPLGLYYCLKKPTDVNIFILVYGVTTIYFSGSMIRLVLLLAPSASLLSAMAIDRLLYTYALSAHGKIALTKRKIRLTKTIGRDEAIIAYIVIFGLLVSFSIHSINLSKAYARSEMAPVYFDPPGIPSTDWQDALIWLQTNAQGDGVVTNSPSVVLSWWDYGYWITNYGEATSLVDNATTNKTQIGMVGTMLMWNFSESVKLMYKYNVKYVLVNSQAGLSAVGSDLGKSIWCIRIAESTVPRYGITEEGYFAEEESLGYTVYQDPFYNSVLYRLCAYDAATGYAWNSEMSGTPTSNRAGILSKANEYPVFDLKGLDGIVYFNEVFRSYGLASSASDAYNYPLVRIFEVVYPENIAQLSAEVNGIYPAV
ncbi:MAG: STT3 domain-containing protein [Candidatus Heimdallarchaeaceae archaeon]